MGFSDWGRGINGVWGESICLDGSGVGVPWEGCAGVELVDNPSTRAGQHVWNKRQLSENSQPVYPVGEHVRDKRQRS